MMMMAAIVMVMVTSMVVYCAHSPSGFGNGQAGDIYGFTMLCVLLLSVCVFDECITMTPCQTRSLKTRARSNII